jgi:hypothetical protein
VDDFENITKNMAHMLAASSRCLDERQIMPCLTLLYAGMDVMASLEAAPGEKVNVYFKRWVEKYLLPQTTWKCSSVDLYGARCAVVHTFTPDSDLSKKGAAKVIYYAHSGGDVAKLEEVNNDFNRNAECLEVGEMISSFYNAILKYMVEVAGDPARKAAVESKAGLWFGDTRAGLIDEYLAAKAAFETAKASAVEAESTD